MSNLGIKVSETTKTEEEPKNNLSSKQQKEADKLQKQIEENEDKLKELQG